MPKVVHCKSGVPNIYVGRQKEGFHFGNPFSHKSGTLAGVQVSTVEEAIQCYNDWLNGKAWLDVEPQRRKWILANLHNLRGHDLGCWCSPGRCHAEVLVRMANAKPREIRVVITGHRPDKLGGYQRNQTHQAIHDWVFGILTGLKSDYENVWFISGMAIGVDQLAMEAAQSAGVKTFAAIPFAAQSSIWPSTSKGDWYNLCERANRRFLVNEDRLVTMDELRAQIETDCQHPLSKGEAASALLKRNEWMINHGNLLLSVWDGTTGGTHHATMMGKDTPNIERILRLDPNTLEQSWLKVPESPFVDG